MQRNSYVIYKEKSVLLISSSQAKHYFLVSENIIVTFIVHIHIIIVIIISIIIIIIIIITS